MRRIPLISALSLILSGSAFAQQWIEYEKPDKRGRLRRTTRRSLPAISPAQINAANHKSFLRNSDVRRVVASQKTCERQGLLNIASLF